MNDTLFVHASRINVAGMVLSRQSDGTYTANVKRAETTFVETSADVREHHTVRVPWDLRVGQEWLQRFPDAWSPAS